MKSRIKNANSGQSIIEVLVALSLVVVVIVGLITVTTNSIKNSSFARDQEIATKYAQESLENTRKLKEDDPNAFWQKTGVEEDPVSISRFTRKVTYSLNAQRDAMRVVVLVIWSDSKGQHQSSLETTLTKWK